MAGGKLHKDDAFSTWGKMGTKVWNLLGG